MSWEDPLDKVPQIRVDYANHIVYGGALALAVASLMHAWVGAGQAIAAGGAAVLVTSVVKKVADFVLEHETPAECAEKVAVTCAIPAFWLIAHASGL